MTPCASPAGTATIPISTGSRRQVAFQVGHVAHGQIAAELGPHGLRIDVVHRHDVEALRLEATVRGDRRPQASDAYKHHAPPPVPGQGSSATRRSGAGRSTLGPACRSDRSRRNPALADLRGGDVERVAQLLRRDDGDAIRLQTRQQAVVYGEPVDDDFRDFERHWGSIGIARSASRASLEKVCTIIRSRGLDATST